MSALLFAACSCSRNSSHDDKSESTEHASKNPEARKTQVDCTKWKGGAPKTSEPLPMVAGSTTNGGRPPVRGFIDFTSEPGTAILRELQLELDAISPEFATCGLKLGDLRSLHFAISSAGVMQGRIIGLPPLEELVRCPLVPHVIALAQGNSWIIENSDDDSLRVRRKDSEILPETIFAFTKPKDQWLGLTATAGPSAKKITVDLRNDPKHELLLEIKANPDLIESINSWCQRFLQHQASTGVAIIGSCQRPNPTTIQFVPEQVAPVDAIAHALSVRTHLFETFSIHGASMLPGLRDGDVVFVDKFLQGQVPPRGAVVVFDSPDGTKMIKRVVGLPGERLELTPRSIQIDGKPLVSGPAPDRKVAAQCGVEVSEQRLGAETFDYIEDASALRSPSTAPRLEALEIPDGHVYVLGDNRPNSKDSRSFGPVPVARLDGIATFITWSAVGEAIDWERTTLSLAHGKSGTD